jgi:DNA-binding winged helix-turn-helix (wHTH) protein
VGLEKESETHGASQVRRFAGFEADLQTGELRKNGMRIRIQEQPFQILAMLLQRPGRLVSREELRQKLWPADTFVDFDQGLNTAINKLREHLGDSATHPRFVETLPKRGYRFIFPVESPQNATSIGGGAMHPADREASARVSLPRENVSGSLMAKENSKSGAVSRMAIEASVVSEADELPKTSPAIARLLFVLLQALDLTLYISVLANLHAAEGIVDRLVGRGGSTILLFILVTALIGIAVRLYFSSATTFDYKHTGRNFLRIFPAIFILDEIWALSPLLMWHKLGYGLSLAAVAALVWLPFAQRTLIRMAYDSTTFPASQ